MDTAHKYLDTAHKYLFANSKSEIGLMYFNKGVSGDGHPDWRLVGVGPRGLYILRRKTWIERLFGF